MKKAVIIIPTYNEEKNIEPLIDRIEQSTKNIDNWKIEVLFVDSQSSDNTQKNIEEIKKIHPNIHLFSTSKEGLGKAYFRGFHYAIEKLDPYVVFEMDADLSHPPEKIPDLLLAIEKGADFVVGSRYIKGGSIPDNWGPERKLFSVLGNFIVRFGFMKFQLSDWTGGYRAIKIWVIKKILPNVNKYSGYVFQIALLDNALKHEAIVKEVPFHFADRKHGISKINALQYISQVLLYVFLNSSFIKFVIVGFSGFFVDFGLAYLFINSIKIAKAPANMLSAEGAIICNFFLNNFWSFKHKKIKGGLSSYLFKFLSFNFVSLGAIAIQGIGLTITLNVFGDKNINLFGLITLQSWIVYKVLLIAFLVIPYSYILYNKIIWRGK